MQLSGPGPCIRGGEFNTSPVRVTTRKEYRQGSGNAAFLAAATEVGKCVFYRWVKGPGGPFLGGKNK